MCATAYLVLVEESSMFPIQYQDAGVRKGLLDFRPEHMGPFGTFERSKFEIVD